MVKKKRTMKQASVSKTDRRAKPMAARAGFRADGRRYKDGGKIDK